ncbi:hypothetical protein [Bathymodiolus japonicus methanotrophic gill symbiont]|uniref:hypothetical protein n=1 Tax=Bathymodiolus japonicus methanotrophic gill symbiont TaxID=113269 RepID=UPI001E599330|nr:hypothetical protein [Bathymodiolus japonicus methanotrophic gill symbiont]
MCSVCGGRRAAGASPIRCVGERITATGVPEFREVAWRACHKYFLLPRRLCLFRHILQPQDQAPQRGDIPCVLRSNKDKQAHEQQALSATFQIHYLLGGSVKQE